MRLKIKDTNFTNLHEWLFKLTDESGKEFYIMNASFYKSHGLESPISKKELDYLDRGQWISATVNQIDGKEIVINLR